MTTFYVYAIASTQKDWIYVGMTNDIVRRFSEHQKGYEKTTKTYRPFVMIYSEESTDRAQARIREKYWKAASGKRKLRLMRNQFLIFSFSLCLFFNHREKKIKSLTCSIKDIPYFFAQSPTYN